MIWFDFHPILNSQCIKFMVTWCRISEILQSYIATAILAGILRFLQQPVPSVIDYRPAMVVAVVWRPLLAMRTLSTLKRGSHWIRHPSNGSVDVKWLKTNGLKKMIIRSKQKQMVKWSKTYSARFDVDGNVKRIRHTYATYACQSHKKTKNITLFSGIWTPTVLLQHSTQSTAP